MKGNSAAKDDTAAQETAVEPLPAIAAVLQPGAGDDVGAGEPARGHHALRTALTAILGFSEIIERELLGPIGTSQYRDYARNIHDTGIHLLALADQLLGTAPSESQVAPELSEVCDLGRVIEEATALVSRAAGDADIAIATQVPQNLPCLLADRLVLQQIVISLLSGAIRASASGGLISAEAGLNAEDGLELVVHAQICAGAGLASDGKGSGALSEAQCAAIGLSVPQCLVELQGGRLDVDTVTDGSVVLILRFPPTRVVARRAKG